METFLLRVFQAQVELQCQAVVAAATELDSAREQAGNPAMNPRVWISIENILTAAGKISKALWGQRMRFADQREPLRRSLDVDDSSVFADVAMRDHFEHYDERLDRWWQQSVSHNHMDRTIMPAGAIQGIEDTDIFRWFDPSTNEVIFWGQRFDLHGVVAEAERIGAVASREASKPHF